MAKKKGTLADFARYLGVTPATARQWKRRGKILERDGRFQLVGVPTAKWEGYGKRDAGVTVGDFVVGGDGVTSRVTGVKVDPDGGVTVASQWEDVTPLESVTTVASTKRDAEPWPYEPLPLVTDCPTCHGARWACGCTPIEELTQIEVLTKDNRILSDAVDSLRNLTTEQGAKISDLQHQVDSLRTMVHAVATENQGFRERMVACERDNEKLKKDARTLYEDSANDLKRFEALEGRVDQLEASSTPPAPDFTSNTGTPPSWLKKTNYSGARNDLGEPYFD